MPELDDYRELERRLATALIAADPVGALDADGLPAELAAAVRAIDSDGLRLAALLVAKLRFERLMNGSNPAREWFAGEPAGFTAAFQIYHRAVPPTAAYPTEEAEAFRRWLATREEGLPT